MEGVDYIALTRPRALTEQAAEPVTFGALLKRLRVAAGLSQEELAERARLSVESVGALERGRRRAPYRETIRMLADALGADAGTRGELERAAGRQPRLGDPARGQDGAGAPAPPHNLLRPIGTFFGRQADLDRLAAMLDERPLVTLVGAGGIGKTRLASELGWQRRADYRDGVWFADLSSVAGPPFVANAIADALRIPNMQATPTAETIVAWLRARRVLLIIDNCEHVIDVVAALCDRLLRECPDAEILATSREHLRVSGERVFQLTTLETPGEEERGDLARFPAVALFLDRAASARETLPIDAARMQTIAAICRRLAGIPLAIELAATRVAMLSLDEIEKQLREHFSLLGGGARIALPRQQTMHATIAWSYDLLSDAERLLMRRIAVFANGFTLDAFESVCDDVRSAGDAVDAIGSLVAKSLVLAEVAGDVTRYRLLEPIRAFARERLRDAGELSDAARRHARWIARFIAHAHELWETAPSARWAALVSPEIENVRTATAWALEQPQDDVALGIELVAGARRVWARMLPGEGVHWIAIAKRRALDIAVDEPLRASLALADAQMCVTVQQYVACLAVAAEAEAALLRCNEPVAAAEAAGFRAFALAMLGRPGSRVLAEHAVAVYAEQKRPQLSAYAVNDLGLVCYTEGDLESARKHFRDALRAFRALDNQRGADNIAGNLAELEFLAGDVEEALRLAKEAVANNRHGRDSSVYLANIAAYLNVLERYDEAREYAFESIALFRPGNPEIDVAIAIQHVVASDVLGPSTGEERRAALERSAQLLGFVDQAYRAAESPRSFTEQQEYTRMTRVLMQELEADYEDLALRGASWALETAIAHTTAFG